MTDGQSKIDEALEILKALGMPKAQQNEWSALTLLALVNLHPQGLWQNIESPMIGVTPIMDWCRDIYSKEYVPNTRETFRRQTLHQFLDAGFAFIIQINQSVLSIVLKHVTKSPIKYVAY